MKYEHVISVVALYPELLHKWYADMKTRLAKMGWVENKNTGITQVTLVPIQGINVSHFFLGGLTAEYFVASTKNYVEEASVLDYHDPPILRLPAPGKPAFQQQLIVCKS